MAEYIEREALLNRIAAHIKQITPIEENRDRFYHDSGRNGAITGAILEVQNLPAADVVPKVNDAEGGREGGLGHVVHGRWEDTPIGTIKCTLCGSCYNMYKGFAKYCPHCGAKMDGEEE